MSFDTIELRRYATRPGKRDVLIELFEREFVESQEALGMVPVGHYRDLDDPDTFVWFRGFPEMRKRAAALQEFYRRSPVWKENRDAANATISDSDNVLLLKSARPESCFDLYGLNRRPEAEKGPSFVGLAIFMQEAQPSVAFVHRFEADILPSLRENAERIAYFVTDERSNQFPALPVREGEHALVVAGVCRGTDALDTFSGALAGCPCEVLRLEPGARSLFR
ncbi:MAG: NIPSNAP family protein [Candidatus Baltobacteraceae bacterium]